MIDIKCSCERSWLHCRGCGSKNVYVLLRESELASAVNKTQVLSVRCKKCMRVTSNIERCEAPRYFAIEVDSYIAPTPLQGKFRITMTDTPAEIAEKVGKIGGTLDEIRQIFLERGFVVESGVSDVNGKAEESTNSTSPVSKGEKKPIASVSTPTVESDSENHTEPVSLETLVNEIAKNANKGE